MIRTTLTPANLYISEYAFNNLVYAAEQKWYSNNQKSTRNDRCVQYWIDITPEMVNPEYIKQLKDSYTKAGWGIVRIEWVNNETTLMVFLA